MDVDESQLGDGWESQFLGSPEIEAQEDRDEKPD
jgi:hypothetical protein